MAARSDLVLAAFEKVKDKPLLVNAVSKRARELIRGARPLLDLGRESVSFMDIALRELAEERILVRRKPREGDEQAE